MSRGLKPNPRYDHAWAVVRLDMFSTGQLVPDRITVVRVFWTAERATEEATRLNTVNEAKDCLYFATVTRVERLPKTTV